MKRKNIRKLIVVGVVLLGFSSSVFALTNEEMLKLLDEKFLKGEISESIYLKLQKKYGGGEKEEKSPAKPQVKAKPSTIENLMPNGGFEEGDPQMSPRPTGWISDHWSGDKATFQWERSLGHTGNCCVKIECAGYGRSAWTGSVSGLKPNTKYWLSVWVKSEDLKPLRDGTSSTVFFNFSPIPLQPRPYVHMVSMNGSKDWTKITLEVTSPPKVERGVVNLLISGNGAIWFDDVEVVEVVEVK